MTEHKDEDFYSQIKNSSRPRSGQGERTLRRPLADRRRGFPPVPTAYGRGWMNDQELRIRKAGSGKI